MKEWKFGSKEELKIERMEVRVEWKDGMALFCHHRYQQKKLHYALFMSLRSFLRMCTGCALCRRVYEKASLHVSSPVGRPCCILLDSERRKE